MTQTVVDQLGSIIEVPLSPQRIISLVPSQTELLFDLGLGDRVVGITKFCIHPSDWFNSKTRIGGTKKVNYDTVRSLNPDLIIGNKEENTIEDIELLRTIAPVWMSDVNSYDDALSMIHSVGKVTDTLLLARRLTDQIETAFNELETANENTNLRVRYLIWKDPYFQVGNSTFIDAMITKIGWVNICKDARYPEWQLTQDAIDVLLLSSEPYPFKEEDIQVLKVKFPNVKIAIVDGELFSWYGSRMRLAPDYFKKLIDQFTG
jgi:ABC-type Fe3+-hydroxamate transport system substrate-binding protein